MARRRGEQARDLVGQVKRHAITLIAYQAFEAAHDFPAKAQKLHAIAFNRVGSLTLADSPVTPASVDAASHSQAGDAPVCDPPVQIGEINANGLALPPPGDKLTIKDLCAHFGISRRCLMRLFAQHEHCSPGAWVRCVRLEAARLMHDDGHSFKVIATRLGYSSRSSVWRLVKRSRPPASFGNPLQ